MKFERFSTGDSFLHHRDTRVKLISTALLSITIALGMNYQGAGAGLLAGVFLVLLAKLDSKTVLTRLLIVNTFTLFLWLTLPITYPGNPLFSIGPLTISDEGVHMATLITLKTNAIVLIHIALIATSTVTSIGYGLGRLRIPDKLCLLLLFSYRYIFVIYEEYRRLSRAAALRCFHPGMNIHTYRTYGYLFGVTLVRSFLRADRVNQAMMLRGFHGKFYSIDDERINRTDLLFLVAAICAATGLGVFELYLR